MISIRYAEASDKLFWFSLDKHLPESEFADKVRTKRAYILSLDNKPIGLLRYNLFWDSIPFCTMFFISEEYRGRGFGRQLISYWENDMKKQGCKTLLTSTQVDETAQHFYRKLGYKDCGCLLIDTDSLSQPMEMFLIKSI